MRTCNQVHPQQDVNHPGGHPDDETFVEEVTRLRADNARLRLLVAELVERKPLAPFERTGWFLSPGGFAYDRRAMRYVPSGFEPLWRRT